MEYDTYNREERYLCAHLFRLLHEWAPPQAPGQHFAAFLERSGVDAERAGSHPTGIFFEVALIRDAYFARKPEVERFMDRLAGIVARQEQLDNYTPYSDLPDVLRDPSRTHPKQIRRKATSEGIKLSKEDSRLYSAIQGMFNAKPDLAITTPAVIVSYEAKFTEAFDPRQITRTEKIAEVWSQILYEDLGYEYPPSFLASTVGPARSAPDVSWEWLLDLVRETLVPQDRTLIAFENAVALLAGNVAG